jgi:hypothetical protein
MTVMTTNKEIESSIKELLSEILPKFKVYSSPNDPSESEVRQTGMVSLHYLSEDFSVVANKQNLSVGMRSEIRYKTTLKYKVCLYHKDLREGYDYCYELIDKVVNRLSGENITNAGPIIIESVDFDTSNKSMWKVNINISLWNVR